MTERVTLESLIDDEDTYMNDTMLESSMKLFDIRDELLTLECNVATYKAAIAIYKANGLDYESHTIALENIFQKIGNAIKTLWEKFISFLKSVWEHIKGLFVRKDTMRFSIGIGTAAAATGVGATLVSSASASSASAPQAIKSYRYNFPPEDVVRTLYKGVQTLLDYMAVDIRAIKDVYSINEQQNDDFRIGKYVKIPEARIYDLQVIRVDATDKRVMVGGDFYSNLREHIGLGKDKEIVMPDEVHITDATYNYFSVKQGEFKKSYDELLNKVFEVRRGAFGGSDSLATQMTYRDRQTALYHYVNDVLNVVTYLLRVIAMDISTNIAYNYVRK